IKRALMTMGKRCKLIYDSHELEPDPLVKESNKNKKLKQDMLASMLNETDSVITVSESLKTWYSKINPHLPIEVIYNSPPLATSYNPGKGMKNHLTLAFEGMIDSKRASFKKLMDTVMFANQKIDLKVRIIGGTRKSSSKD